MIRAIIASLLISLLLAAGSTAQTFYGTTDWKVFRQGRDREFRDTEKTPLSEADLASFTGLSYFAVDSSYRVQARFERTADEKFFLMPTSSTVLKKFVKYGALTFRLSGTEHKLSVYQGDPEIRAKFPEYANLLFIPFRDLTSGHTTYGVGRYIDIRMPKGNIVILDFNLAYNPNCAYGTDKYSCPIPPKENHLKAEIRAGEKKF
ncbi:MAG: DUF1684 domain-containing protein [Acidobacteriota bacterium]